MSIPDRLREIMQSKGWGIVDLSECCDIPYRSLQNYLGNDRKIGIDALVKIYAHLSVNINWLLTGEGEMYQSQLPVKTTDNKLCGMFEQLSPEQQQLVLGMTQELIKINAMQSKMDEIFSRMEGDQVRKQG